MFKKTANAIYTEIFGSIDNKQFEEHRCGQIEDWLREGDLDDEPSITELVWEWIEYDNIGVYTQSDSPNGLADVWNDLTNYQSVEGFFRDRLAECVQSYDFEMPRWIILNGVTYRTVDALTEYVVDILNIKEEDEYLVDKCQDCNVQVKYDPGYGEMMCSKCAAIDDATRRAKPSKGKCPDCGGQVKYDPLIGEGICSGCEWTT